MIKLNIVTALYVEAKPIIKKFNLKKDTLEHAFEIYHNIENTICLIISGIGKLNAAIATVYIAQYRKTELQGFINYGIAAGNFEIGELFIASKISTENNNKYFYPKINFLKKYKSIPVNTVDEESNLYFSTQLIEMEAYGFYLSALKFTTQEFIHVIKIVSDNSVDTRRAISAEVVKVLIEKNLASIAEIILSNLKLLQEEKSILRQSYFLPLILNKYYVSQQQQSQLTRLLQRAEIFLNETCIKALINNTDSTKTLIKELNRQLENRY